MSLLHNRKVVMTTTVAQNPVPTKLVNQLTGAVREVQRENPVTGVIVMTVPALMRGLGAQQRNQIAGLTPKELHKVAHAVRKQVGARRCSVSRPPRDTRAVHATFRWEM